MSLLRFEEVQVTRAGRVLDLPRLELDGGEVVVLLGENGAGKSTLLHAAAGQLDLARGRILLDGEPLLKGRAPAPRRLRQQIGLVLQEPLLLGRDVRRAVTFGLRVRGVSRAERQRRVAEVLEQLALTHLSCRGEQQLSGGERRQVALAAALVIEPRLLLLDEVTSGLDQAACKRVEQAIRDQARGQGAVLISTHQAELAGRLGDRVIRVCQGKLEEGSG